MNASTTKAALASAALLASNAELAAGGDLGQVDKQPTNWVAISMFAVFGHCGTPRNVHAMGPPGRCGPSARTSRARRSAA